MGTLKIVKIGNPVLRKKCDRLPKTAYHDETIQQLLQNMVETMQRAVGVGLAANQVGVGLQVIVLECEHSDRYPDTKEGIPLQFYMNPKITEYSKETTAEFEGCLSIPGYRGMVPRSKSVTFEAVDAKGKAVKKTVEGFHARIMQHEVDHLNGLFYIDRMPDLMSYFALEEFNERYGTDIKEENGDLDER